MAGKEASCIALVICAKTEYENYRHTLHLVHDGLEGSSMPITTNRLDVFAIIAKGSEDYQEFMIGLFDPAGNVFRREKVMIRAWGPVDELDISVSFHDVSFYVPGMHHVILYELDDRILMKKKFLIRLVGESPESSANQRGLGQIGG